MSFVKEINPSGVSARVKAMTALEKEILNLPRLQKISIMEQIWADLSKEEEEEENERPVSQSYSSRHTQALSRSALQG